MKNEMSADQAMRAAALTAAVEYVKTLQVWSPRPLSLSAFNQLTDAFYVYIADGEHIELT